MIAFPQTADKTIWGGIRNSFLGGGLVRVADKQITSAQLLNLFATPIIIAGAPGANRANVLVGAMLHKPAGTAYAGIAAGEDLAIKYTGAAGLQVAGIEATGFLDQATVQTRYANPFNAASGDSSITPVANAAFVLHMLVGEITTGDSPLNLRVLYMVLPTVIT